MEGVLQGLRVIELGTFITGPYAGMLLANLGADVIKVEQPQTGDPFRNYEGSLYSPQFCAYNVNKRSVTINLKDARGRELLYKLAAEADVFIENYRPGVADQLGVGWDHLKSACPKLIYCSITGFGSDGPYMDRPCYDTVAQALSGYLSQFLDPVEPRIAGPAVADAISGMFAAYGILGAVHERDRTGRGKRVEVAMLDSLIAFAAEPFASYFATGRVPTPYSRPSVSQSYVLKCADSKLIALHLASPDKFWSGLTECIGRPELASDDRFTSRNGRIANFDALTLELRAIFEQHPRDYWLEKLPLCDVPHAPVATLDEVPSLEQVQHRKTFQRIQHSTEGEVTFVRSPITYDGDMEDGRYPPPTLSEHTEEVLREIGYEDATISEMRREGVI
jgi:crotonobetainyl-CoA:carnitine CoA-transferase CaiB-like acyl-CoA transferase